MIDGLTYKFDLTQPNKYDREGKLVNQDVSRVRDLAYQGQPIDLNQTPSTQAGFAEYRLIVKEKANQVEDTANKESEKLSKGAETVDQTKRMTPKVIEGSSLVKPATAIQLSNSQVIILPQAQIQETQVSSSAETLPNTGSDESVSAILAGLVLVTLAGFFGIKKYKKIKQEKKPMSGLFCSSFTVG